MKFQENDIRPPDLMKLKEPALAHDKKFLSDRSDRFVFINCPACESKNYRDWGQKEGFNYVECCECRTVYMNPRASEELLHEFYQQSKNYEFWNKYIFPASENVRKEKIFTPRAKKVIGYCDKFKIKHGVLLEIGSAFGTFCEIIKETNYFEKVIALEPTPELAATCRKKSIETIESSIEKLDLKENSVDIIVNFEVIEHVFSPFLFVENCVKFLKKNGLFICTCPSINGIGTIVLREKAKVVDHEHLNYFSPDSLKLLLEKCDLEILEVSTPGELDVDLLKNAYLENDKIFENQDFITHIILSENNNLQNRFQSFLAANLLSSHLWIVAKKRKERHENAN